MNPAPPIICGTLLAAMMAAGFSHYWSVREFVANYPTMPAVRLLPDSSPAQQLAPTRDYKPSILPAPLAATSSQGESTAMRGMFQEMLDELRRIKEERNALMDQLGETNRDVMRLQFQVDSHSRSFRPLPTSEERNDTTFGMDDELPGVLPPRANPVYLDNER